MDKQKKLHNASGVINLLGLNYGRNTLYKKLRESGILDENNCPNEEMRRGGFITYTEKTVWKGGRRITSHSVPLFTNSGVAHLAQILKK